jgi:hypothetical protein
MVAMLGLPRATPPEPGLHLTLAFCAGHTLAALLAAEASYRVPTSDVLEADDDRNEDKRRGRRGAT